MSKEYKGELTHVLPYISSTPRLHLMAKSVGHPVYDGMNIHTSAVVKVTIDHANEHTEIETRHSTYHIEGYESFQFMELLEKLRNRAEEIGVEIMDIR